MKFRLAAEGFVEVRRSLILRMGLIMPLACGGGLYFSGARLDEWVTYLIMAFFAVVAWYSYKRSLVRQRCYWDSFEIELGDAVVVRRVAGYPDFELERAKIGTVAFGRTGDLEILAGVRRLTVPRHLVNIETLKRILDEGLVGGASSAANACPLP